MSMTIEELDATVRAFFEGRGETVGVILCHDYEPVADIVCTAKTSSSYTEPGTRPLFPYTRDHRR